MTVSNIAPSGAPKLRAEVRTVTPTTAKAWLKQNRRNRRLVPNVVAAYARDMAAGNWQVTGEAIKIDTDGNLADGQHRLSAVIESDTAVEMLIVHGVLPETQAVMDAGKKRTAADALTLTGTKNPVLVAAAARFALREPGCGFITAEQRVKNPTTSEIAEFIDAHPEIHRAAELAQHYYPAFDAHQSVLAICWMRFSEIDIEACALFFNSIANMTTDGKGDPRAALIRRLATARRDRERLPQVAVLSAIFRTWNWWRNEDVIEKIGVESRYGVVKVPEVLR